MTGWPRAIAWGEFSELDARPAGEKEDAQISSQLKQPDQVAVAQEHGQFKLGTYTARMMVERTESWVVKTQKTDELLQHEQGHYDITGLTARDLVADLKALRKPTTNELGTALQDLIAKTQELGDRLTKEYDTDTDHSRRKDRQVKWNQHLAALKQSGARLTAGPQ